MPKFVSNRHKGLLFKGLNTAILLLAIALATSFAVVPVAASDLKADEEVIFFPVAAHLDETKDSWIVPVHGWVFEPEEDSIWRSSLVNELAEWLELGDVPVDKEIFRKRARLFLVDNERDKNFIVRVAGLPFDTPPSGPEGHFRQTVEVERENVVEYVEEGWLPFQVETGPADGRKFGGRTQLVPPKGMSVISDIDDTIKISNVLDKQELLANTFLRKYQPVPGMAEAYRDWAGQGAAFHYVSASPWQLYSPLADFMSREQFPSGSFDLRSFRIKDRTFFNLFASPMESKVPVIVSILSRYPGRQFILVGDSGEKDPEVYGEVARRHKDQLLRIYIRNVPDSDVSKERLEKAFSNVDPGLWKVFTEAGELTGELRVAADSIYKLEAESCSCRDPGAP